MNLIPLVISAQPGGFESWISLNKTGTADSYMIVGMSGVSTNRFKIDTTGIVLGAPTNLVIQMVGSNEVLITWDAGLNACYYMVRGAVDRVPLSRTDGYLVYNGTATSTSDYVDPDETIFYRVWSHDCVSSWEENGIYGSTGGATLVLLAILGFCAIISFIAMRSSFFGLKLMAGMSWFGFFIYFKDNPPSIIAEGSGAHWALLVIAIGFGLMIVLAGLGRGIEQTKDRSGNFSVTSTGGFKMKLPKFMTNSGEEHTAQRKQDVDDYRERMHRALHPNEKEKR